MRKLNPYQQIVKFCLESDSNPERTMTELLITGNYVFFWENGYQEAMRDVIAECQRLALKGKISTDKKETRKKR